MNHVSIECIDLFSIHEYYLATASITNLCTHAINKFGHQLVIDIREECGSFHVMEGLGTILKQCWQGGTGIYFDESLEKLLVGLEYLEVNKSDDIYKKKITYGMHTQIRISIQVHQLWNSHQLLELVGIVIVLGQQLGKQWHKIARYCSTIFIHFGLILDKGTLG